MTIKAKLSLIVWVFIILMPVLIVVNWQLGIQSKRMAEENMGTAISLAVKAKDMQLAVVQVQQWLTDISATRAAENFDDGFMEAEHHAKIFHTLINDFQNQFARENNQQALNDLKRLGTNFEAFYEMGIKMANVYIKQGPEDGNQMMAQFDPFALAITASVEKFVSDQVHNFTVTRKALGSTLKRQNVITLSLSSLILLITIGFVYVISRSITATIKAINDHVEVISKGDLTNIFEETSTVSCADERNCTHTECPSHPDCPEHKEGACWSVAGSSAVEVHCPRILKGKEGGGLDTCEDCGVFKKSKVTESGHLSKTLNAFLANFRTPDLREFQVTLAKRF